MSEPISALTILKELHGAYPTFKEIWKRVTKADERDAGKRLVAFMESKRVFIQRDNDIPYGCYESCKLVFDEIVEERTKLPSAELMAGLYEMQLACNKFKGSVEGLGLADFKSPDSTLASPKRVAFREAIIRFRYEMGVQVAAVGEAWSVPVPRVLLPSDLMKSLFPNLKTR